MFDTLGFLVRRTARDTARKAAFGASAMICLLVGLGFLTAAAWLGLAAAKGPIFASIFIGLVYAGIGLVLMTAALVRPRPRGLSADLDDEAVAALNRAAVGGPGEMERAMRGLLTGVGMTPPVSGGMPALAAAFVFGLTLALSKRRR